MKTAIDFGLLVRTLGCILAIVGGACFVRGQETENEPTEPRQVAIAFFSAIADQEVERALECVLEPEKLRPWVESQCELSGAFNRWNEVVTQKLGDAGRSVLMPNPLKLFAEQSQRAKVKESGDIAEFPMEGKPPLMIRRWEGKWKLDIYSAYHQPGAAEAIGVSDGDQALGLVTRMAVENTKLLSAICDDVESEEVTTADQVRHRLRSDRDQIAEAMEQFRQEASKQSGSRK